MNYLNKMKSKHIEKNYLDMGIFVYALVAKRYMATDQNHEEEEEGYSFIKERIVPKKKTKMKKVLVRIGATMALAIIFGIVGSFVFCVSGPFFSEKLGIQLGKKISFSNPSLVPSPTPVETVEPTSTPVPRKNEESKRPIRSPEPISLREYSRFYALLSDVAVKVNQSVVTVSSVVTGVDLFDNPSELTDASYGLVIANNGEKLLVLTNWETIEDANGIRVMFSDDTTAEAKLYGLDNEIGIAVIAVSLKEVSENTLSSIKIAILGESYNLSLGTPIIALGNPNGYVYSMGLGIISNQSYEKYITDYKLELFNTDLPNYVNGEGFIVNVNGEVVGILTHGFEDDLNKGITRVLGISKVKIVIEKLVNKEKQIYCGIIGSGITNEFAKEIGAESGVYISEVVENSPGFKAGLQIGDVITKVNGERVSSIIVFHNIINQYKAKDIVEMEVVRTTKLEMPKLILDVQLGRKKN